MLQVSDTVTICNVLFQAFHRIRHLHASYMSLFSPTRDKLHLTVSRIMLLGFKIRLGSCAGVDMVEVGNSRAFVMYRGSQPTQGSSLSKRMLRLGRRAQFFRALPSSRVHRSQHVEVWSARVLYFSPFDMKTCTCRALVKSIKRTLQDSDSQQLLSRQTCCGIPGLIHDKSCWPYTDRNL